MNSYTIRKRNRLQDTVKRWLVTGTIVMGFCMVASAQQSLFSSKGSTNIVEKEPYQEPKVVAAVDSWAQPKMTARDNVVTHIREKIKTLSDGTILREPVAKYYEVSCGLNYVDESGERKNASVAPRIQVDKGVVSFDQLPVKYTFSGNVNMQTVVTAGRQAASKTRAAQSAGSAVAGISYYDLSSGKSRVISGLRDAFVRPFDSGVYYEDAFDGIDADLVYRLHAWGLEQDIVIYGDLPLPEDLEMEPETTFLCVLTELVDARLDQLSISRNGRALPGEPSAAPLRISLINGKSEEALFNLQRGFAFMETDNVLQIGAEAGSESFRQIINMRVFSAEDRVFLSEEIPVSQLLKKAAYLFTSEKEKTRKMLSDIPPVRPLENTETVLTERPEQQLAYRPRGYQRFVVDYVDRSGAVTNDITFETGESYLISGEGLYLSDCTLTVEPGSHIFFTNTACIVLENDAVLNAESHAISPALFTSMYDTNHDCVILGTGNPESARYETALQIDSDDNLIRGFEIRYAQNGLLFPTNLLSGGQEVRDCQFISCSNGISLLMTTTRVEVVNCLFVSNDTAIAFANTNLYINAVTVVDGTEYGLAATESNAWGAVANSLFADVSLSVDTNQNAAYALRYNAFYNTTGPTGSNPVAVGYDPFLSGTYGAYYLSSTCGVVDAGSTNADSLGLYHFTTLTSGTKETTSTVNIGFHYPGTPLDTDSDTLYDLSEDSNGNGLWDSALGETDWTTNDTDGDLMRDDWELLYSFNPLSSTDALADADADGLANRDEYAAGTHPLNPDTDNDGLADGFEVDNGLNPLFGGGGTASGYWTYNENSGSTAADSSVNSNNGTLYNISATNWCEGVISNALYFDGANDYVQYSDSTILKPQRISISAWIKPSCIYSGSSQSAVFFSKEYGRSGYSLRYIQGNLDFMIYGGGYQSIFVYTNLDANTWYHFAGTYDGSYHRIYLDGACIREISRSMTMGHSSGAPRSGASCDWTPGAHFNGIIDDIQFYTNGLSSNEVWSIYEVGADFDGDGLSNWKEAQYGSCPTNTDTDSDSINDAEEIRRGTLPDDAESCNVTLYVTTNGVNSWDGLTSVYTNGHGPKRSISSAISESYSGDAIRMLTGSYDELNLNPSNRTLYFSPADNVTVY